MYSNTNCWETKQLVVMSLMCAISTFLSFVEFPIFPAAVWLKYDASFVPAMVVGFAYGGVEGLVVGFISVILHGLISGDFWGAIMNLIVVVGFVLPSAIVYKHVHTLKGACGGLVLSLICAVALAIVANLLITPIYTGMPVQSVALFIVPILIPFNVLKTLINSILTLTVYKSVSNLITPRKDWVVGR